MGKKSGKEGKGTLTHGMTDGTAFVKGLDFQINKAAFFL